jgi:hypothetical protein
MHCVTVRERRIERLWKALAGDDLAGLVVAGKGLIGQYGTLEWCAGYVPVVRGAYAVLTPGAEPALVVTTAADGWYARRNTGLAEVRVAGQGDILSEYDDPAAGVAAALAARGVDAGRIGIAGLRHVLTGWEAEQLAAALPGLELVDVSAQVGAVKAVKEPEDVAELRATAAIADTAFEAFLERLAPGVTGWELNGEIERVLRTRGTRDALIFISGGAYFLERPSADPVRAGDLLTVFVEIVGPTGYWIELGRLVAVGELDGGRSDARRDLPRGGARGRGRARRRAHGGRPGTGDRQCRRGGGRGRRDLARPRGRCRPRPAGDHGREHDAARAGDGDLRASKLYDRRRAAGRKRRGHLRRERRAAGAAVATRSRALPRLKAREHVRRVGDLRRPGGERVEVGLVELLGLPGRRPDDVLHDQSCHVAGEGVAGG